MKPVFKLPLLVAITMLLCGCSITVTSPKNIHVQRIPDTFPEISTEISNKAALVVGDYDDRFISVVGHQIYVSGNLDVKNGSYGVYRRSKLVLDPATGATTGYEIMHIADVALMHYGDPSTLIITNIKMQIVAGDLVFPSDR